MPITPFHFGPGAAMQALAPRSVSFLAFCAANVLIDLESLHNLLMDQYPVHGFMHSAVGATLALLATFGLYASLLSLDRSVRLPNVFQWKALSSAQVFLGAALGAYSHVLLDGIMHADAKPFAPFSDHNPLLGLVAIDTLHILCAASGALAVAVSLVRGFARRRP